MYVNLKKWKATFGYNGLNPGPHTLNSCVIYWRLYEPSHHGWTQIWLICNYFLTAIIRCLCNKPCFFLCCFCPFFFLFSPPFPRFLCVSSFTLLPIRFFCWVTLCLFLLMFSLVVTALWRFLRKVLSDKWSFWPFKLDERRHLDTGPMMWPWLQISLWGPTKLKPRWHEMEYVEIWKK